MADQAGKPNVLLIYYPVGNRVQLFDIDRDPHEQYDLEADSAYSDKRDELAALLVNETYGRDHAWIEKGALIGAPDKPVVPTDIRNMVNQRGIRYL